MQIESTVGLEVAERFNHYEVYSYEHIDDQEKMPLAEKAMEDMDPLDVDEIMDAIKARFKKAGWEGDGDIRLLYLPPFVFNPNGGDTFGTLVWFVKQSNNGTSFLASPEKLHFPDLERCE